MLNRSIRSFSPVKNSFRSSGSFLLKVGAECSLQLGICNKDDPIKWIQIWVSLRPPGDSGYLVVVPVVDLGFVEPGQVDVVLWVVVLPSCQLDLGVMLEWVLKVLELIGELLLTDSGVKTGESGVETEESGSGVCQSCAL